MSLKKFPLDSQVCQLLIGSYGFTSDEVYYEWAKKPLSIDALGLAQFHMVRWEHGVTTNVTKRKIARGFRNDSVAHLNFYFERQTGFFLLQIYTPLLLIVMCSWVAFWIVKTDVPARCALGITTVLSVTKIGFGGKGKPQVGYPTALDIFVLICFMSVFAALVEFAVINFITVFVNRYKAEEEKRKKALDFINATVREIGETKADSIEILSVEEVKLEKPSMIKEIFSVVMGRLKKFELVDKISTKITKFRIKSVPEMYIYTNTEDALDSIDEYARKCFPICFLFMMFLYWTSYLYLFEDELYI